MAEFSSCTWGVTTMPMLRKSEPYRTDFFQANWNGHVRRLGDSLDSDDVETVQSFKSRAHVEILLRNLAPSIGLIQPAVRHLHSFVNFFETRLGSQLDASYFWGSIGCLLQLTADPEDSEMLEKVPRMIKAIAHKAEAFNTYCASVSLVSNPVKEACFDMQILFVEFFTHSIQCLHGTNERHLTRKLAPHVISKVTPMCSRNNK